MAMKIIAADCSGCGTCEFDCPNGAIRMKGDVYAIDAARCTECDGGGAKCASVCPADAIVAA